MTDYKRDPVTGAWVIENGDLVRVESTKQHQQSLLLAQPGTYKQFPPIGVGLIGFLNSEDTGEMMRAIRLQFTGDGMTVKGLEIVNGAFIPNAVYGG